VFSCRSEQISSGGRSAVAVDAVVVVLVHHVGQPDEADTG
jgi:hypothetical protein